MRVQATAPAYGQDVEQSRGAIESQLAAAFPRRNEVVTVERGAAAEGHDRFTATLTYRPTLFGLGMRSSVLGVPIPPLSHRASMVVDCYKPGVIA